jgi:hypothetical protein
VKKLPMICEQLGGVYRAKLYASNGTNFYFVAGMADIAIERRAVVDGEFEYIEDYYLKDVDGVEVEVVFRKLSGKWVGRGAA